MKSKMEKEAGLLKIVHLDEYAIKNKLWMNLFVGELKKLCERSLTASSLTKCLRMKDAHLTY